MWCESVAMAEPCAFNAPVEEGEMAQKCVGAEDSLWVYQMALE